MHARAQSAVVQQYQGWLHGLNAWLADHADSLRRFAAVSQAKVAAAATQSTGAARPCLPPEYSASACHKCDTTDSWFPWHGCQVRVVGQQSTGD